MKRFNAPDMLFWFILIGLSMATFGALIGITVLTLAGSTAPQKILPVMIGVVAPMPPPRPAPLPPPQPTASPQPSPVAMDWSTPIDLNRCHPELRLQSWGMGSNKLQTVSRSAEHCEIEYVREVEGGYTVYRCLLPVAAGKLVPSELNADAFCQRVKSGNVFLDQKSCDEFRYSACPERCVKRCVPSVCSPDGVCTADCDGPGSCAEIAPD